MLIAHLSDTHLGATQFGLREREEDVYEAFDEVVETAIKDRVEAVIHAGDIFDSPKPSGTALVKLADALERLRAKGIRFFFTLGEHDISRVPGTPSPLLYHRVGLATYVGDGQPVTHRGLTVVGYQKHRRSEVDGLLEKLRSLDALTAASRGKKILVLHQGLVEAHRWAGELSASDLPRTFDYYAMGHLHDRFERRFDGLRGVVCYPGSTEATHVEGIRDFRKGFYLVDLSGPEARTDWIEIRSLRRQYRVELEYDRLQLAIGDLIEKLQGAAKKPILLLRIRGTNIASNRVSKSLESLQPHVLYHVWEPVAEEGEEEKTYLSRPVDLDAEILQFAAKITGSPAKAAFAVSTLLPLLAEGRGEEAFDLLWKTYTEERLKLD